MIQDLVLEGFGCEVFAVDGTALGTVRGVFDNGAQDLLMIEDPDGGEHLLPAVAPLLRGVDLAAGRIVVDPPPGLLAFGSEEEATGERE